MSNMLKFRNRVLSYRHARSSLNKRRSTEHASTSEKSKKLRRRLPLVKLAFPVGKRGKFSLGTPGERNGSNAGGPPASLHKADCMVAFFCS